MPDRLGEMYQRLRSSPAPNGVGADHGHAEEYPESQRGDAWEPREPPQPPRRAPGLHEADAAELAALGADLDLEYLPLLGRDGYLVRGWSHLVASAPRAGKTELLTACIPGWLRGGDRVLYLTEEPDLIWRLRLGKLPGPWSGMRLVFGLGAEPADLLERVERGGESVAVIDTIRNLGVLPGDECDNSAVAQSLGPWVAAARRSGKTLVLVHHMRKGGGDHGEGIAGGHALLGSVDVALEIRRGNQPERREVRGYARLIQPADLLYERSAGGQLVALGDPAGVGVVELRRRLVDVLTDEWQKTGEIVAKLGAPRANPESVRKALLLEAESGAVERDPPLAASASGKTARWRLGDLAAT